MVSKQEWDDGCESQKLGAAKYLLALLTPKSTRIKDAGIAIRHSRGGILFYTAGSRNGVEGLDGNGVRSNFMKKKFQSMKKGFASFQTRQKRRKRRYLGNYASKLPTFDGKLDVKAWRRLWNRSRAPKTSKKLKNLVLAPSGLVTLVQVADFHDTNFWM